MFIPKLPLPVNFQINPRSISSPSSKVTSEYGRCLLLLLFFNQMISYSILAALARFIILKSENFMQIYNPVYMWEKRREVR